MQDVIFIPKPETTPTYICPVAQLGHTTEPEFILHSAPVDGLRIPQSDSRSQRANVIDAALNTYYHSRF